MSSIKKIAIIGAGPSGLATGHALKAQGFLVTIYDRQPSHASGGVWYHSPSTAPSPTIPQTSPSADPKDGIPGAHPPEFAGPMYDNLHANISKSLMPFPGYPFKDGTKLLPKREDIWEYLQEYEKPIRDLIRYNHLVTDISLISANPDKWSITAQNLQTQVSEKEIYDAVVIASGHYTLPFIPAIAGLSEFAAAHPEAILHSKEYRNPTRFTDKKVIIVGNGSSGIDVARQISPVSKKPLYLSVRHPTDPAWLQHSGATEIAEIKSFNATTRSITLTDDTVISSVDYILFATGFLYSLPFSPRDLSGTEIHQTNGHFIPNTYQHIFSVAHPTLAFVGLPQQAIPYVIAHSQGAVLSAVWSGKLALPSLSDRQKWCDEIVKEKGSKVHSMTDNDGLYVNELADWVGDHAVIKPTRWTDYQFWERRIFMDVKMAFEKDGERAFTYSDLNIYPE